jgi:hypothetical protein
MAKIKPDPQPAWPWGGDAGYVSERLVRPAQVDRRKLNKKGNPKSPPLASVELLEFIGPPHGADELRFPLPVLPEGHEADLDGFLDRPHLADLSARADEALKQKLEDALAQVRATPERKDRLGGLLAREAQMLEVLQRLHFEVREIDRRRREEQQGRGT